MLGLCLRALAWLRSRFARDRSRLLGRHLARGVGHGDTKRLRNANEGGIVHHQLPNLIRSHPSRQQFAREVRCGGLITILRMRPAIACLLRSSIVLICFTSFHYDITIAVARVVQAIGEQMAPG